jgi:hypothetical protein
MNDVTCRAPRGNHRPAGSEEAGGHSQAIRLFTQGNVSTLDKSLRRECYHSKYQINI